MFGVLSRMPVLHFKTRVFGIARKCLGIPLTGKWPRQDMQMTVFIVTGFRCDQGPVPLTGLFELIVS